MFSKRFVKLGVRSSLQCSCSDAVDELKQMDTLVTPIEKLYSVQNVTSLITKSIQEQTNRSPSEGKKKNAGQFLHSLQHEWMNVLFYLLFNEFI